MTANQTHNLLIISDLHLGEDLKPASESGSLRHVPLLERQLESFLDNYRRSRRDGRPWELIINGDMVDFLSVCLFPDGEPGSGASDPEDHVWGLGTGPDAAKVKMTRVLERHPGVFQALARFIGAGNKLGIVVGNHDVEFHWAVVQETFRAGVARLWSEVPAAQRPGALAPAEIGAAISFHPWFYYQENVVWVEHGHQYDGLCSFDTFLEPVEPQRDKVVLTVGAAAYRYVANHVVGTDPHQQEDWSALGHLRFSWGLGAKGLLRMLRGYWGFVAHLLTLWRAWLKNPDGVARRRDGHRRRMRELAEKFRLEEETLVALDELRHAPVTTNLGRLVMVIMLDQVAVAATTGVLAVAAVLALPAVWAVPALALLFVMAWTAAVVLARARGHTDPDELLRSVPQKIRAHVAAPFVVFGHSHKPAAVELDGGGWYFNTGTWVATEKPGLLRAFTHVMIRHAEGGPHAELCQWRDGRSLAFAPAGALAAVAAPARPETLAAASVISIPASLL